MRHSIRYGLVITLICLICLVCAGCAVRQLNPSSAVMPATVSDARDLGLILNDQGDCVSILAVRSDSIASLCGLKPGDVVRSVNGQATSSTNELNLQLTGAGSLLFEVERGTEQLKIELPLSSD